MSATMRTSLLGLLFVPLLAFAAASEHAPKGTFAESFLDIPEDVRDAAKLRRRVIVFFEQDGCPACVRMGRVTFADAAVAERLKRGYVLLAVDIFGARDTVWTDGVARTEKALGAHVGVRGTPTVVILDEKGLAVQRFVGYRDPAAFLEILDAAAPK